MALYRWSTKLSWIGNGFNPSNTGTVWQVITKTSNWYDWEDPQDTTYTDATQSTAWLMSATDKTKLDGIASWAQVNSITWVKGNSESTYRTGNVNITKSNIWLGNVDNTSDASKPVSTAQQTYIDNADANVISYVDNYKQAKTLVQSVAPADAPFEDWEFYYDTTAWVLYVSSWYTSANDWKPISWNVNWLQISPNSPLTPKYVWYWTQAQYDALSQYYTDEENDTVYFTI